MKEIITPGVREEAECVCDVTGKPAVAKLVIAFDYYGGRHDCHSLTVDLCEHEAAEVMSMLQQRFPQVKMEEDRDHLVCPWCHRLA